MKLATLENQDYAQLAEQVQAIVESKSDDNLYEIIGNALYDSGLDIAPDEYPEAAIPITFDEKTVNFSILKSMKFVEDTTPISKSEAQRKGKKLWQRIKKELCGNEKIKDFFTGESNLKENLKTIIPIILGLISSTLALGPLGLAIAVAIIALLFKVGYQSYCEI
ncbi:MAG: hypothetical protein WC389_08605 [Lutibacter sp.]|jgi:hypothetical protein